METGNSQLEENKHLGGVRKRRLFIKAYVVQQAVLFSLLTVEILLGLRVLLKLLGANSKALFVQWLYDFTYPLARPFLEMFPSEVKGVSLVIEFSVLFGMLMYGLAAYILILAVDLTKKAKR